LEYFKLNTAVQLAASPFVIVARERFGLAVACCFYTPGVNAFLNQIVFYSLRSLE
jgi:hypothetical protein